ncbi:MAG TPA: hypothetical protein GX515_05700 [Firmicutes bacterium]|nr:hypothetical protein [Bacillota bacterium]
MRHGCGEVMKQDKNDTAPPFDGPMAFKPENAQGMQGGRMKCQVAYVV